MIKNKEYLRIPGPTPIPPRVIKAMSSTIIYHRSVEFGSVINETVENAKKVFKTSGDVLIFSASGRGVMEATLVNIVSPGEKVLILINGEFGEIFADIAKNFRAQVERLEFPKGEAVDIECFEDYIRKNKSIKAVLAIHCETSTGVVNDVEDIGKIASKYGVLSIIDAVSSLGGIELSMDKWGIDFVLSASQKCLMTPPGLGLVAVSPRAWKAVEESTNSRYYWDFRRYREYQNKVPKQTPFTSPVSLMIGLNEALNMIDQEGIDNVLRRHREVAKILRSKIKNIGLELFPKKEEWCSNTVTAVKSPEGMESGLLIKALQERFNLRIANGLGNLEDKIFRVGHMGYQAEELEAVAVAWAIKSIIDEVRKQKENIK